MEIIRNRFVQPLLMQVRQLEGELIALYAEACYSGMQAAYGNRSCMERAAQLDDVLHETQGRLAGLHTRLRRLGLPLDAPAHLDANERLALFEAALCRHDATFTANGQGLSQQLLCDMLEDFADTDPGIR